MNPSINKFEKIAARSAKKENARLEAQSKRLRSKNAAESKRSAFFNKKSNRSTPGRGSYISRSKSLRVIYKKHKGGLAGVAYSQKKSEDDRVFYSNMFGSNPLDLLKEFHLDQLKKPLVQKTLFQHVSLSFHPGSNQTPEQIKELINQFFKNIGSDGQFVSYFHNDQDHHHVHIIFSRLNKNGILLSTSNDFWKHRQAAHDASQIVFGCSEIDRPSYFNSINSDREKNSKEKARRLNKSFEHIDPSLILNELKKSRNAQEFQINLRQKGIDFKPSQTNGKTTGVVFKKVNSETWLAGSSIDRTLSLPKIQQFFDQKRNIHNQNQPQKPPQHQNQKPTPRPQFYRPVGG